MPITQDDIKLLKSEKMDDTPDGGGRMVYDVIVSGQSNNIFDDISELDRVYGNLSLRKVYSHVDTPDVDRFYGSYFIITKLPGDEKLGVNLFLTNDHFDFRDNAQSRIESYRARGAKYQGFLWSTQWTGSAVISIFQSEGAPIPEIGDVLYLSQYSEAETQYVKVSNVTHSVQNFADAKGTYTRRIVNLELSQPLLYDFVGVEINRSDALSTVAEIRNTVIADAARYYSSRPLALAATVGDTTVKVDTVFSSLVPSSLQENAITDEELVSTDVGVKPGATIAYNHKFEHGIIGSSGGLSFLHMNMPIVPGSFYIEADVGEFSDLGGNLMLNGEVKGSVDYRTGLITFDDGRPSIRVDNDDTISFEVGAIAETESESAMLPVTPVTRGSVYTITLDPLPAPGSVRVAYQALGKWYTLADNGAGGILGDDDNIGTGTVNYLTGTVSVTLANLPDVNSAIMFYWGTDSEFFPLSASQSTPLEYHIPLTSPIDPTTLSGSFTYESGTHTFIADAEGKISATASPQMASIDGYVTNDEIVVIPSETIGYNTAISLNYDEFTVTTTNHTIGSFNTGTQVIIPGSGAIEPGSVSVEYTLVFQTAVDDTDVRDTTYDAVTGTVTRNSHSITVRVVDDGAGNLVYTEANNTLVPEVWASTATIGGWWATYVLQSASSSVNYTTGEITLTTGIYNDHIARQLAAANDVGESPVIDYGSGSTVYTATNPNSRSIYGLTTTTALMEADLSQPFVVRAATSIVTASSQTWNATQAQINLGIDKRRRIIPNSIFLTEHFNNDNYIVIDDGNGQLYGSRGALGEGELEQGVAGMELLGTVDYNTGIVNYTATSGTSTSSIFTLRSMATTIGDQLVDSITYYVPNPPIRAQSFQLRFTKEDGTVISTTSDANGEISHADVTGYIDYETGIGQLNFTTHVYSKSVQYNAVSQQFIPLDESILGLNPVRLPEDGRVPIYQTGGIAVVLNDQTTILTVAEFDVTNLGRTDIKKINVYDSLGDLVDMTSHTVDLAAGTITWGSVVGLTQPLTIVDRIEDVKLVTDFDVSGNITFSSPLNNNFPDTTSLVASAALVGDVFATTSIPFDQATWTSEFSDNIIGGGTAAQFNHTTFPIIVENEDCIEERWAIVFTSSTTVDVIGENVGEILSNVSIASDIAPNNPVTGQPYFILPFGGWGAGWSTGNVLRFNTYQAGHPVWVSQAVAQGDATDDDYTFCLEYRGDVDTP